MMKRRISKLLIIGLIGTNLLTGCGKLESAESIKYDSKDSVKTESSEISVENNIEQAEEVGRMLSSKKTNYYKNALTDQEDIDIYNDIYNVMINREESIILSHNYDNDKVYKLFLMVLYDNPEIYYCEGYNTQSNIIRKTFYPVYNMSSEKMAEADEEIADYKEKVFSLFDSDDSVYDIELKIYDYIAENTDWVEDSEYNQSMYSTVSGETVCAGYSMMFMYLCEQAGIDCMFVSGEGETNNSFAGHAWNCVKLGQNDEDWYMVDITKSKGILVDNQEEVSHYLFNVSKDMITRMYSIDNLVKTPDCENNTMDYYKVNGLYFEVADTHRLSELIENKVSAGENTIEFRCKTNDVYDSMLDQLFNQEEVFAMVPEGTTVTYVKANEMLVMQIAWE